jgi:uncharacterized membrane protein YfcA
MPFTLLVGVLAYRKQESIDMRSALRIAIPGTVGVCLGTMLACSISGTALRIIFGVALVLISVPLAMKKRPASQPTTAD